MSKKIIFTYVITINSYGDEPDVEAIKGGVDWVLDGDDLLNDGLAYYHAYVDNIKLVKTVIEQGEIE